MAGRRDDGYEVRSRLEARPDRRGRIASAAFGVLATAWLVATLSEPRPGPVAIASQPPPRASTQPAVPPGPTFPPAVETFEGAPRGLVAAMGFDGLTWFDARNGSTRSLERDGWETEWAFLRADGETWCVCVETGTGSAPGRARHLRIYGPSGEAVAAHALAGWPNPEGGRVITAAELDPTGAFLLVATAAERRDGWSVRLARVAVTGDRTRSAVVGRARLAGVPRGSPVDLRLWLAPDGGHARVRLSGGPDIPTAAFIADQSRTWNVPLDGSGFGPPVRVRPPAALPATWCFAEGWATASEFVAACVSPRLDSGNLGLGVFTDSVDGTRAAVGLGALLGEVGWLLDRTRGDLFLWEPGPHRLRRVHVPGLAVAGRRLPLSDLPADAEVAEAPWPAARASRSSWQPRVTRPLRPGFSLRPIAGSPDGSVIYTVGYDVLAARPGAPRGAATGVWAFDADTLELVGRWRPVGTYDAVAVTADGRHVVALGGPSSNEFSAFGNHGLTIAFHHATSGDVTLILRQVVSHGVFLVPEPYP